MNKIKRYENFNEEINFDYFKNLLTGVKTDDDKLAKKILKDIDKIEFSHVGLYPHTH
jgi:transcription termination factor NusB